MWQWQYLVLMVLAPAVIDFCLLRCGIKQVTRMLLTAVVTGAALTLLVFGPPWSVQMTPEPGTSLLRRLLGLLVIGAIPTFAFGLVALIPALIIDALLEKTRRSHAGRPDSAA
jgi:hypothetical protein